jgi:hypothetical protein
MLQLRHVFLGRRFLRERPWQHKLGLEHGIAALDSPIQSRRHPAQNRMADSLLDVGDHLPAIGLVPAPIEILGGDAELNYEIAGQVLRLDFSPFLLPQPDQRLLVAPHDDPGIRAADETAAIS